MFCHNCGKDCGDFKFCPHCGTQMKNDVKGTTRETAWSVGKPCPQCGGMEITNGCCAFCGVQLVEKRPRHLGLDLEEVSSEIPCGRYKAICGALTLYENSVLVTAVPLFKKYETKIPYNKITEVVFERFMVGTYTPGHLVFRWEGNKDIPMQSGKLPGDKTRIAVAEHMDVLFYHIYCMLKALAPKEAVFQIINPDVSIPGLEELAKEIDWDLYFEKYAPFRNLAVEEICKRNGVTKEAALVVVNREFDERQEKLYANNPEAAIWDLNLIVGRKNKEEVQAAKERAQKKARITQELILEELREHNRK